MSVVGFLVYIGYLGPLRSFTTVTATRPSPLPLDGTVAILFSGDMGFSIGMGPQIADKLAAKGISVVGVNTLAYFRTTRTPAEARALVEHALAEALALPGARRVVLIGQSFGADQLQAALPRLPEKLRKKIMLVALVVPLDTVAYRASPSEIFSAGVKEFSALPTARTLTWTPVICIHGAKETDSLCPLLRARNVDRVTLPGGHLLRQDVDRVAGVILSAIQREARR